MCKIDRVFFSPSKLKDVAKTLSETDPSDVTMNITLHEMTRSAARRLSDDDKTDGTSGSLSRQLFTNDGVKLYNLYIDWLVKQRGSA